MRRWLMMGLGQSQAFLGALGLQCFEPLVHGLAYARSSEESRLIHDREKVVWEAWLAAGGDRPPGRSGHFLPGTVAVPPPRRRGHWWSH